MSNQRIQLFGISIDAVRMRDAVRQIDSWCRQPLANRCRFVVTPNVDHAVMVQSDAGLRQAYDRASMILADGAPVVLASRLLGKALPERVAGSDLVPALFDHVNASHTDTVQGVKNRLRVFLLGAAPGVAAVARLEAPVRIPARHRLLPPENRSMPARLVALGCGPHTPTRSPTVLYGPKAHLGRPARAWR